MKLLPAKFAQGMIIGLAIIAPIGFLTTHITPSCASSDDSQTCRTEHTYVPTPTPSPTPTCSPTPELHPSTAPTPTPSLSPTPELTISTTPNAGNSGTPTDTSGNPGTFTCTELPPNAVPNFIVVNNPKGLELEWAIIPNADTVDLRYGLKDGAWQYGALNLANTGNYLVQGLAPHTAYFFQIAGVRGCAIGPWSTTYDPLWRPL